MDKDKGKIQRCVYPNCGTLLPWLEERRGLDPEASICLTGLDTETARRIRLFISRLTWRPAATGFSGAVAAAAGPAAAICRRR